MTNRDSETPRSPIAVEPLESRVCLSSPLGGDVAYPLGHVADAAPRVHGGGERHTGAHRGHHARAAAVAAMQMNGPRDGARAYVNGLWDNQAVGPIAQAVIAMPGMVLVITFPAKFATPPMLDAPPVGDGFGDVVTPRGAANGGTTTTTNQTGKRAMTARANAAELVQAPAGAMDGGEVAAAVAETNVTVVEDAVAGGTGPMLASATTTMPAAQTLATNASAVIDRLTSSWHDGSVAAAGEFAADALVTTEWLPAAAQTFVATAVDAASNLLAPVAETASAVVAAVTPVTNVAAYEIAHIGSPFALLADSVAAFVEESATVSNAVATANARPWALTAGVIAVDVVILTYVYRRKSIQRRAQLAPVGVG